ncbi:MAG TPA: hypothetical protein PK264_09555 [Hyphomicrobiaceae bacterium]|nr:hypothetical protein [Hyphomicrobiaceae bacterium]
MSTPNEPLRRRRFLRLRIVFFLLSLPLAWWAVTRFGGSAAGYLRSYPSLTGPWFWFATFALAFGAWGIWRLVKRKWARAKELAGEARSRQR